MPLLFNEGKSSPTATRSETPRLPRTSSSRAREASPRGHFVASGGLDDRGIQFKGGNFVMLPFDDPLDNLIQFVCRLGSLHKTPMFLRKRCVEIPAPSVRNRMLGYFFNRLMHCDLGKQKPRSCRAQELVRSSAQGNAQQKKGGLTELSRNRQTSRPTGAAGTAKSLWQIPIALRSCE